MKHALSRRGLGTGAIAGTRAARAAGWSGVTLRTGGQARALLSWRPASTGT